MCARWLHERLGNRPGRDQCIPFYEDTKNMPADVYTKAFPSEIDWHHAIRLINVFDPAWITPEYIKGWLDKRASTCLAPEVLRTNEVVHQKFSKAVQRRDGSERRIARTNDRAQALASQAATGSSGIVPMASPCAPRRT